MALASIHLVCDGMTRTAFWQFSLGIDPDMACTDSGGQGPPPAHFIGSDISSVSPLNLLSPSFYTGKPGVACLVCSVLLQLIWKMQRLVGACLRRAPSSFQVGRRLDRPPGLHACLSCSLRTSHC